MNDDVIDAAVENDENIEYRNSPLQHFDQVPEVAGHLLKEADTMFSRIQKTLYSASAFIEVIKASVPKEVLQAVLSDSQKEKIAKGALELMTKKNGTLLANLVNPKTKKIVATVPLKSVKITPEMSQAITSFSTQMQMAQIAEQIQEVQIAVEEVRMGQEHDRLAAAYSCQQKLLQAMKIEDSELKSMALIQLAASAEDSRNALMLSQKSNVAFIVEQPESFFQKVLSGASPEKIDGRMNEIRESLCAVNMVSFVQAMAYREMGESEAVKQSLMYYADFLENTYLAESGLLERLDSIDSSPHNYWTATLPDICVKIQSLPYMEQTKLLEEKPL